MPERMRFEIEATEDPRVARLITNLELAPEGREMYGSPEEGEVGSLVAQTVFAVDGVVALELEGHTATVTRAEGTFEEMVIEEVIAALKQLFL